MPEFLGFDTSNYTTSVAVFNSTDGSIRQSKRLLPVKEGSFRTKAGATRCFIILIS